MHPILSRLCPRHLLTGLLVASSLAVALVAPDARAADDPQPEQAGFDWEAFRARTSAQIEGLVADWTGSMSGDISRSLEGKARLRFVETGNGRLKIALSLGDTHAYYDGISINGFVSCGTGPRTYPVWVQRRAYEKQPPGRLEMYFTDSQAIASRRAGVTPPRRGDMYKPEGGTVSLRLEEDHLDVRVNAVMTSGPISPRDSTPSRIRLQAHARVERTLENDAPFSTSLCSAPPPFEMVKILPEDGRDNVLLGRPETLPDGRHNELLGRPEILLEFNRDVHPDSLDNPDLVVVRTMRLPPHQQLTPVRDESMPRYTVDRRWTPVPPAPAMEEDEPDAERVPGTLELEGPRTLRFLPGVTLRGGVRYQVDVAHGPEGVRSTEFHELDELPPSFFSTRVLPDQVRLHVYQTTRDAPLLLRKPALARVYVDWMVHTDIHPDWQVQEYEVELEITRDGDRRLVFPRQRHRVRRPDLYDDGERRLAEDSINRFGWSPGARDIRKLVARVSPHDPWPGPGRRKPPEDLGERAVTFASSQVEELSVEAYVVRMGAWREEPPEPAVVTDVVQAFQRDNEFSRQLFPVVRVRGSYGGELIAPWYRSAGSTDLGWQAQLLHDYVGLFSSADIVVGYYPEDIKEGRGQGIATYPRQQANVVVMPLIPDNTGRPAILRYPVVAHEYGHVFGLKHNPRADTKAERAPHCDSLAAYAAKSEGIEGFRIAAGGDRGWSKSSTTGNAESEETLKDLMFPCVYDRRAWWWISDRDYRHLVDALPDLLQRQRIGRNLRLDGSNSANVSSSVLMQRVTPVPADDRRWMLVAGFIDGGQVVLLPTVGLPRQDARPEPDGALSVVVEGADGTPLATRRANVVLDEESGEPVYFSAAVELNGEPARVALWRSGEEVAAMEAGPRPPSPRILSHAAGDRLDDGDVLRWEPAGPADTLYSVRYRSAPDASPRVLAVLTDLTQVPIRLASLPAGPEPVIEVVAHSGLHDATTRLPVQVDPAPRPLLVFPVGDEPLQDGTGIGAWFNAPLEQESIGRDAIRLFDAKGREVPVQVHPMPSGQGVQAVPRERLQPDGTYTVHLGAGLRHEDGRVMQTPVRWSFRVDGDGG